MNKTDSRHPIENQANGRSISNPRGTTPLPELPQSLAPVANQAAPTRSAGVLSRLLIAGTMVLGGVLGSAGVAAALSVAGTHPGAPAIVPAPQASSSANGLVATANSAPAASAAAPSASIQAGLQVKVHSQALINGLNKNSPTLSTPGTITKTATVTATITQAQAEAAALAAAPGSTIDQHQPARPERHSGVRCGLH